MNAISRRTMIAALGAGVVAPGCAAIPGFGGVRLPAVLATDRREIRTVVGLRPFRPSGFVTGSQRLGKKTVVHNYGHGGAGVTLSWGTASFAVEEVRTSGAKRVAIIGAGVSGLTVGALLAQRGVETTIYARELQPDTTSNIAGAYWFPSTVFKAPYATPEFLTRFNAACRISFRAFQHFASDPRYGVYWVPHYGFRNRRPGVPSYPGGNDLYPGLRVLPRGERIAGFDHTVMHYAMIIDPDIYLRALLDDFYAAGGKVVERSFAGASDLAQLGEPVIVNCAGLGARELFGDAELVPVRGQLTMLLPQPEIRYAYGTYLREHGDLYMFPRRTSIVLGGSFDEGNDSLAVSEADRARMLAGHAEIAERIGARSGLV